MDTITGRVKEVREAQTFGTFSKREIWVETELDSKYPQTLSIEFTQDNISKLDDIGAGDMVEIAINMRGRYHEGTDKVYNTLTGWKISVTEKGGAESAPETDGFDDDDPDQSIPF